MLGEREESKEGLLVLTKTISGTGERKISFYKHAHCVKWNILLSLRKKNSAGSRKTIDAGDGLVQCTGKAGKAPTQPPTGSEVATTNTSAPLFELLTHARAIESVARASSLTNLNNGNMPFKCETQSPSAHPQST